MTIHEDNAAEASGQNELFATALPFPQLPKEPRAHVAILSPAKRNALVACFHASALNKKDGAWHGLPDGQRTSGVSRRSRTGWNAYVDHGSSRGFGSIDRTRQLVCPNTTLRRSRQQSSEMTVQN
jgi:hypothetical protein